MHLIPPALSPDIIHWISLVDFLSVKYQFEQNRFLENSIKNSLPQNKQLLPFTKLKIYRYRTKIKKIQYRKILTFWAV